MRLWIKISIITLLTSGFVAAQDNASPEQLRKIYDDALTQLKAAQDRKNELAAENTQLTTQIEQLKAQLNHANMQVSILEREAAAFGERTFSLRAHFAAWQRFIDYYPQLKLRWEAYLNADPFKLPSALESLHLD